MKLSTFFYLLCGLLCVVAGMSIVNTLFNRFQKPDPTHDSTGRYQMIPGAGGLGMFDSATGQIYLVTNQTWQLVIPAPK